MPKENRDKDIRFWVASVAGALLLAEGARAISKSEVCTTSSAGSLGLAMLPGVMVLNRLPGAGVVGVAASFHGLVLNPSKAVEDMKSWPWPMVSGVMCAWLFLSKPGRFGH
eukprot:CAMPEP_0194783794 /NCGR_PEP_ID=MMETSP0323_2-20130528/79420_1 /TAXON_ID=2866 ORGANISM="Crypthecodinium cohnii, Strain Seligo" /NCGR_SAMPLE_ID=MMETSP0323_2 /ASSEMBLY_ACC=CAM_ASM_000346 /LENGTH=110 /DNA_ID=CAMNT_0039722713 /DNA_START=47 /DNA_END=379 /DNA_ORIENTATION=-